MKTKRRTTIFLVIVPWDHQTATVVVRPTRERAEEFIRYHVDPKAKQYARIQEEEI